MNALTLRYFIELCMGFNPIIIRAMFDKAGAAVAFCKATKVSRLAFYRESEMLAGTNRLMYAGLILFIPLGIGAWLYDFVVNKKNFSPLFVIPFCIVLAMFVYATYYLLPVSTKFSF
ncbi:hypothetical protein [Alteromonas gilva]|uniref:Uncharacterized protein n=1 Tax=Alteromonas gilva TaxID=2987522 RepID=A0ABT5L0H3_9ALTE|nr:hypothetical protein [Alteromonas gilva]MDC8830539.1 hypothetical protein [Alteromonas gilva]